MSILMVEGWDLYGATQGLILGRTIAQINGTPTLETTGGSLNGNHISMNDGADELIMELNGSEVDPAIIGIHFKVDALPAAERRFITLSDLANIGDNVGDFGSDFQLALNTDGSLESKAASDVTAAGIIQAGTWHKLEIRFDNNEGISFDGAIIIRVDGTEVMNLTNRRHTTTASPVTHMRLSGDAAVFRYDDIYCADTSGSLNNDFAGDFFIETLRPTADGTTNDWTASGGGDNFDEVNEADPDLDVSFVSSQTQNDVDLYEMGNLVGNVGTVLALVPTIIARREVGSTQNVNMQLVGASETVNLANQNLPITYEVRQSVRNNGVDDLTGTVRPTISEVNALEAGVRIP